MQKAKGRQASPAESSSRGNFGERNIARILRVQRARGVSRLGLASVTHPITNLGEIAIRVGRINRSSDPIFIGRKWLFSPVKAPFRRTLRPREPALRRRSCPRRARRRRRHGARHPCREPTFAAPSHAAAAQRSAPSDEARLARRWRLFFYCSARLPVRGPPLWSRVDCGRN